MESARPHPGDERALDCFCTSTRATSRRSCVSFTTWHNALPHSGVPKAAEYSSSGILSQPHVIKDLSCCPTSSHYSMQSFAFSDDMYRNTSAQLALTWQSERSSSRLMPPLKLLSRATTPLRRRTGMTDAKTSSWFWVPCIIGLQFNKPLGHSNRLQQK